MIEVPESTSLDDVSPSGVVLFGRVRPDPRSPDPLARNGLPRLVPESRDVRCIEASGETYAAAKAALEDLVPKGWELLAIARWPL